MLEIRKKLKVASGAYAIKVKGQLKLPFDQRQKSRLRAALVSGEEVGLNLPRGDLLRGGDLLVASDGRVIEVVAQPETVLHITCPGDEGAQHLARAAYHLGNRHVPVEVGDGYLRIAADHVLEEMLEGLGASVEEVEAPFEPEAGAYGEGHAHGGGGHDDLGHGGKIHEYGSGHDDHGQGGHVHDEHCGHDHGHKHDHDHAHDHGHKHEHAHDHEHKHEAHAHDHDQHDHGHKHDHDHEHKHEASSEKWARAHEHDHDHEQGGHDHDHDHGHKGHGHKH